MKALIIVLASAALLSAHAQSGGAGSGGSSGGSSGSGSSSGGAQGSMGNRSGPIEQGGTERSSPSRDWSSRQYSNSNRFGANSNWYQTNGTASSPWNTYSNQNFGSTSNSENEFQGGSGDLDQTDQGAGARGLVTNRPPWSYTNSQGGADFDVNRGIGAGASTNRYRQPGLERGTNFDSIPRGGAGFETNMDRGSGFSRTNSNSNSDNPDR